MSEVLPFLHLSVSVVDRDGANVLELVRVLEDHELVDSVRFSERVLEPRDESADVLFLNPFGGPAAIEAFTTLRNLETSADFRLVLFGWPDQMKAFPSNLVPTLRDAQVLFLDPEPETLSRQVDAAVRRVWRERFRPAEPLEGGASEADPPGLKGGLHPHAKRALNSRASSGDGSGSPDTEEAGVRHGSASAAEGVSERATDGGPLTQEVVARRLIELRFMLPDEEGTGIGAFREAVRRFQASERIAADGRLGPQTMSRLFPGRLGAYEEYLRSAAASSSPPVQVEALFSGLPTDVDVGLEPAGDQPLVFSATPGGAEEHSEPAGSRHGGHSVILPLSTSAQPALRNAVAYHRAATQSMPMSIALLAGIAAIAIQGAGEDRLTALHEDTAEVFNQFLRQRKPRVKDVDLLGLRTFGITRQPAPLPPFGKIALEGVEPQAELQRILEKASSYARRVYSSPGAPAGSPRLISVRHLLAALVTTDEPAFAVPAHLEAQGYSVAELRAELFRFFSTLTERTEVWREILHPLDVLTRAASAPAVPVLQEIEPNRIDLIDDGEESLRPQGPAGQWEISSGEPDKTAPLAGFVADEPKGRDVRSLRFAEEAPAAAYKSDEAAGRDLLNLKSEVNALSAVLASRELRPPLSVGLFGDWGTGKSFFMGLMRTRIRQLSHDARQGRTEAFCPRIVQITFNAWHYMDANLWASLVSGVFDGLARSLSTREDRPAAVRERLLARLAENHAVLAQAEQRKLAAEEATRRARDKLDQVEREKSGLRAVLGSGRDVIGVAVRQPEVTAQLVGLAREVGLPESTLMNLGTHQAKLEGARARMVVVWRIATGQEGDRRRLLFTALFAVLIVGLGAAGWWLAREASQAVRVIAPVIGVLAGAAAQMGAQLRPLYRRVTAAAPRLLEIVREAKGLADAAAGRMDQPAQEAQRRLRQLEDEEAAVRQAHADAVRRLQDVDEEIQEIRAGRRLHRFISERSATQDYRQHLGIVALVRDDFQRLSRLLREARTGAEGELPPVDRIVLYIDDLDRCPETRVVEVLQAVHLLLAFPLFVVVVGVDPRWLLRSVQSHYAHLVEGDAGGPGDVDNPEEWGGTPQNYLEKIFQIPFTLRPMEADEYATLIHGLVPLPGDPEYGTAPVDEALRDNDEWLDFPDEAGPLPRETVAATASRAAGTGAEPRPGNPPGASASDGAGASAFAPDAPRSTGSAPAEMPVDDRHGAAARGRTAQEPVSTPAMASSGALDPMPHSADAQAPDAPSGGESQALGHASAAGTGAGEGAAESSAQTAVQAAEQGLVMEGHERAFLQTLSPLIPSPRSAKRLVNVYRFIRASLAPAELGSFVGADGGSGDYRPVALLLAIVTGFPTQAVDLFRALEAEKATNDAQGWWAFFEALTPREADAAKWSQLQQALARVKETVPDLPLEPFIRWAPHVARFSFQTGQLFARRHG